MHPAKIYLEQIKKIQQKVDWLDREIERNRSQLMPGGIRYDLDRVQTSPQDRMSKVAAEVGDLLKRQEVEQLRLAKLRDRILRQITELKKPYSDLLRLRYVELMSFYKIAEHMDYSYEWVRHMHKKALDSFDKRFLQRRHKKTHLGMLQ